MTCTIFIGHYLASPTTNSCDINTEKPKTICELKKELRLITFAEGIVGGIKWLESRV
jgi:hypothetical protein